MKVAEKNTNQDVIDSPFKPMGPVEPSLLRPQSVGGAAGLHVLLMDLLVMTEEIEANF